MVLSSLGFAEALKGCKRGGANRINKDKQGQLQCISRDERDTS